MKKQRDLGTALISWVTDRAVEAPPTSGAGSDEPDPSAGERADPRAWTIPAFTTIPGNELSESDLRDVLRPQGRWTQEMLDSLFPLEDGWGHPLRVFLRRDDPLAPQISAILSPGRNGRFDGPTYEIGPFGYASDVDDLVWSDGFFVRWPGPPVLGRAEEGDPSAQLEIAKLYYTGESDQLPQNCEAALSWALKAAEGGVTEAQRMTGHMLERGIGTTRDVAAAARWFEAAARVGDSISQARLGDILYRDDPAEARRWLTAAAEQGDANAMLSLWSLGATTREFDPWLQMAADRGHAVAHLALALRFHSGTRVPPNRYRAYVHYSVFKALNGGSTFVFFRNSSLGFWSDPEVSGSPEAIAALEALEGQLPPVQLIQAQEEATRLFQEALSQVLENWIGDCR